MIMALSTLALPLLLLTPIPPSAARSMALPASLPISASIGAGVPAGRTLVISASIGAAAPAGRALAIRADKLLLGDGRAVEKGVILIEDGVIRAAGADVDVPADAVVVEHKGFASAGLIALHGYTGAPGEMRDSTRTVLPGAEVAYGFDPAHSDFADALKAGITSLVLTPPPQSLCGGISAVVKTALRRVVRKDAQLSLGFSAQCLRDDRFPTSYSGALAELERLLEKSEGPFSLAARGKLPVILEVSSKEEVARAAAFAKRHDLAGAIFGAAWAGEVADAIKDAGLAVVCGPIDPGAPRRDLRSVLALVKAGIPIGFALESPWRHPATLRVGAAMCVREGLDPAAAWKALTSDAARIAGVADRVGRLDRGLDADLVLWSGDPLDLGSAVVAVYVDGEKVYGKEP